MSDSAVVEESSYACVQCENDVNCRPGLTKRGNPFITKALKYSNIPKSDFNRLIKKAKLKPRCGRWGGNLEGELPYQWAINIWNSQVVT
jgi:hypothetical protein